MYADKIEKAQIEFQYSFFEGNRQKMLGNFKEASANYNNCLKINPKSAAANYEMATLYAMTQNFEPALNYAQNAYSLDPSNKWYQTLCIGLFQSLGQNQKAAEWLQDFLEKNPDEYDAYLELANSFLQINKPDEALKALDNFENRFGFSEELMVEKNRIHIQMGNYVAARLEVQKILKLEPENMQYQILLADLYFEDRQPDKAFEIYQEVLKIEPNNGQVHFSLSEYYDLKGDTEKSFEELKLAFASDMVDFDLKIKLLFNYVGIKDATDEEQKQIYTLVNLMLEKYPNDMKVHSLYSDILVKDKLFEEAQRELILITKNVPDNYDVWEQLMYIDNQLDRFQDLFDHSVQMLNYFPEKSMAYFFAGLGAYQIEKYQESVDYLESGLPFSQGDSVLNSQFHTLLGDAFHKLRKHEASDQSYEKAISLNSKNFYVYNNYSYFLSLRAHKLDRATELMEVCISKFPNNLTYLDTYAWVLYQKKQFAEALKLIEKSYQNGGDQNDEVLEHYGDILYQNNRIAEAVDKWKEAKSLGKGSNLLDKKIAEQRLVE